MPRHLTRSATLLLVGSLAWGPARAQPGPPPPSDELGTPELTRARGGARILILPAPELGRQGRVLGRFLFQVGSVHDPAGRSGLLEVLGLALRGGGSMLHDGRGLDAWLARNEASIAVSTRPGTLEIEFSCPRDRLEGLLERLSSLLTTPAYPAPEIEAARKVVLARLDEVARSPAAQTDLALRKTALGAECAWARASTRLELEGLTRSEVLGFHRTHLGQETLWVGLACGEPADAVRAQVARSLAPLPKGAPPVRPPPTGFGAPEVGPIWLIDRPELTRVELHVAIPAPGAVPERRAFELWMATLSHEGAEDPLLVQARRLIGDLDLAPLEAERRLHPLAWVASGSAPVDQARPALEALRALLSANVDRRIPKAALAAARVAPAARMDPGQALAQTLRDVAVGIDAGARAAEREARAALTDEEVETVVRTRLPITPPVVVVAGPATKLVEPLSQLGSVLLYGAQAEPRGTPEGLKLRAQVLAALGGADAWAQLGGVHMIGDVNYEGSPRSVPVRIWRDLVTTRLRLEHRQNDVPTTVVVTQQAGWSQAIQALYDLPREQWQRVLFRERRQLVRVLHDLAAAPSVEARRGEGGRLEVHDKSGLICWIELDSLGRPARLGYGEGSLDPGLFTFGNWTQQGPYLWPALVTQPLDGTVFRWSRFVPYCLIGREQFERPAR